jgi:hypothetical protein
MTYALTETLAGLKSKDITCRELYELTRNRVQTWYPQQIPQCEGDRDRLLFSSERPGQDFPFNVIQAAADFCLIDGGRIHGLSENQEFEVFPPDARLLKNAGNAIARLKIEHADSITSRCCSISGAWPVTPGSRLLPFACPGEASSAARSDQQQMVMEIRNPAVSDLSGRISVEAKRLKPSIVESGVAGRPTNTSTAEFELISPDAGGELRIQSGTSVCFCVTNNSAHPLYCQILSLGYDGSISRIWPKLTGEQVALEPGRTLQTSRFKLMFAPSDNATPAAKEFIKVFAATVQFDVDMLCTGQRSSSEALMIAADWTTAELGYELFRTRSPSTY